MVPVVLPRCVRRHAKKVLIAVVAADDDRYIRIGLLHRGVNDPEHLTIAPAPPRPSPSRSMRRDPSRGIQTPFRISREGFESIPMADGTCGASKSASRKRVMGVVADPFPLRNAFMPWQSHSTWTGFRGEGGARSLLRPVARDMHSLSYCAEYNAYGIPTYRNLRIWP